ncbi:hypothetical protein M3Y96_00667100 [Aphelenchoides besseyi]|nr:hypothetical protein M3Y96_00667100 [Aphelenchoides besseyi]
MNSVVFGITPPYGLAPPPIPSGYFDAAAAYASPYGVVPPPYSAVPPPPYGAFPPPPYGSQPLYQEYALSQPAPAFPQPPPYGIAGIAPPPFGIAPQAPAFSPQPFYSPLPPPMIPQFSPPILPAPIPPPPPAVGIPVPVPVASAYLCKMTTCKKQESPPSVVIKLTGPSDNGSQQQTGSVQRSPMSSNSSPIMRSPPANPTPINGRQMSPPMGMNGNGCSPNNRNGGC